MRERIVTIEELDDMKRQKLGKGYLDQYQPQIHALDFSSEGEIHRTPSTFCNRTHQLLSGLEKNGLLELEALMARRPLPRYGKTVEQTERDSSSPSEASSEVAHMPQEGEIVDIREQFPLDRDATIQLAARRGIHYPCYPRTHLGIVISVDFLVDYIWGGKRRHLAIDCTTESKLENPSRIERLSLARLYMMEAGERHLLLTPASFKKKRLENLLWIRGGLRFDDDIEDYPGMDFDMRTKLLAVFAMHHKSLMPLNEFCAHFDGNHGAPAGSGLRAARQLMWTRDLIPDVNGDPINEAPLASITMTHRHRRAA